MPITVRYACAGHWLGLGLALFGVACASRLQPAGPPAPLASPDSIESVVFLIGDAGGPVAESAPVLAALSGEVAKAPSVSTILFLGDNIYPSGLPASASPGRAEAVRRLEAQLAVVRGGARGIFLPGNHDWAGQDDDGWDTIRRQASLVETGGPAFSFLPKDGCPGPSVVDIGRRLRLVLLDTEWWLRGGPKPTHPDSSCPADSPEEIVEAVRIALRSSGSRRVAFAAHHPLVSGGPHGGHFTWRDHLFPLTAAVPWLWLPLPIIGSAYPIARKSGISAQDQSSGEYRRMRQAIKSAAAESRPLIYASGHEHLLEVRDGAAADYLLVSGRGRLGETHSGAWSDSTRFLGKTAGFMRLDVLVSGRIRLGVVAVASAAQVYEVFSMWLD